MEERKVEVIEEIINRFIPDLNKREREIIYSLLTITSSLHFHVFPPNAEKLQIFGIVHERLGKIPEEHLMVYDWKQDLYLIFPYNAVKKVKKMQNLAFYKLWEDEMVRELNEVFELVREKRDKKEIEEKLMKVSIPKKKTIPKFTWEEILIGLAAHEVRHRVQKHLPIKILSLEEIVKLHLSYDLLVLAELINENIIKHHNLGEEEGKEELDAALIGHLVVKEWNKGKTPAEISQIIKMNLENFASMRD